VRPILAGILSLIQHNNLLQSNPEVFRPAQCPTCGKSGLWHHGHYERKADYEHVGSESLNPVPILRFYCAHCHKTCSVLPECIPPRRHYPWSIQQAVLLQCLEELNYQRISKQTKPSRWTIRRWFQRLAAQFSEHADHLRLLDPSLGRFSDFIECWRASLKRFPLSSAMLNLNNTGVLIP